MNAQEAAEKIDEVQKFDCRTKEEYIKKILPILEQLEQEARIDELHAAYQNSDMSIEFYKKLRAELELSQKGK